MAKPYAQILREIENQERKTNGKTKEENLLRKYPILAEISKIYGNTENYFKTVKSLHKVFKGLNFKGLKPFAFSFEYRQQTAKKYPKLAAYLQPYQVNGVTLFYYNINEQQLNILAEELRAAKAAKAAKQQKQQIKITVTKATAIYRILQNYANRTKTKFDGRTVNAKLSALRPEQLERITGRQIDYYYTMNVKYNIEHPTAAEMVDIITAEPSEPIKVDIQLDGVTLTGQGLRRTATA